MTNCSDLNDPLPGGYWPPAEQLEQCTGAVWSGALSSPERCALWAGHDGKCEQ